MRTAMHRARGRGFSLVEVNLAILLIGLGLLAIFGLFPSALKEGDYALQDTHTAQFAEFVLSGLRAKTMEMTWEEWQDNTEFVLEPEPDGDVFVGQIGDTGGSVRTGENAIEFPMGSGTYVSYLISVQPYTDGQRRRLVHVWASSGKYASTVPATFKSMNAQWYCSVLFYAGAK